MPQLILEEFRGRPATAIVSLGRSCATAYNVRRHYNFGSAFPFDWWWAPESAMPRVLERLDADYIYDPAMLELTEGNGSVRHRELRILLHHEFPRDHAAPGGPVRGNFLDHLATPKRRTAYLIAKFRALDAPGARILTVTSEDRVGGYGVPLARLFGQAEYAIVATGEVGQINVPDWRGDPRLWDDKLAALGVSFERGAQPVFAETTAQHTDRDLR